MIGSVTKTQASGAVRRRLTIRVSGSPNRSQHTGRWLRLSSVSQAGPSLDLTEVSPATFQSSPTTSRTTPTRTSPMELVTKPRVAIRPSPITETMLPIAFLHTEGDRIDCREVAKLLCEVLCFDHCLTCLAPPATR